MFYLEFFQMYSKRSSYNPLNVSSSLYIEFFSSNVPSFFLKAKKAALSDTTSTKGILQCSFFQNMCICHNFSLVPHISYLCDNLYRFCILRDIDDNPRVLYFHYFFPCWDFDLFCQKYTTFHLDKVGFICNEEFTSDSKYLKHLQSDLETWIS